MAIQIPPDPHDALILLIIIKPLDFSKFVEVIQTIEHFWIKVVKRL